MRNRSCLAPQSLPSSKTYLGWSHAPSVALCSRTDCPPEFSPRAACQTAGSRLTPSRLSRCCGKASNAAANAVLSDGTVVDW